MQRKINVGGDVVISLGSPKFVRDKQSEGIPGPPGYYIYNFKAIKPGTGHITFSVLRGKKVYRTSDLEVEVK